MLKTCIFRVFYAKGGKFFFLEQVFFNLKCEKPQLLKSGYNREILLQGVN